MSIVKKKICLIGDFAVGKTSLIRRYVEKQFRDQYLSTVGVKISKKLVTLQPSGTPSPVEVQMMIWDLEGRTQFEALTSSSYLQGAMGAIVVGAMNRQATLGGLEDHIELFGKFNPKRPVIVALNKADLVPPDQHKSLRERYNNLTYDTVLDCQCTSAKTGENVDALFETLAKACIKNAKG
ncbi:MAG: Rab family GTPase [Leptolyngbyaceae cyanobacterium]